MAKRRVSGIGIAIVSAPALQRLNNAAGSNMTSIAKQRQSNGGGEGRKTWKSV